MRPVDESDSTRESIDRRLAALVATQYGVFSRGQAAQVGVARSTIQRRIAMGRWDRLYRDVFRIGGSPPSWRQSLMAACLSWGPGAVVSHLAAAALWKLVGFEPGLVEVTVPRGGRRSHPEGVVVHWLPVLPPPDVASIAAIPVTSVARTLIDVASVAERDAVEEALDDALRRKLVSLRRLRWRVTELGGSGRKGVTVIRSLLEARDPNSAVPESVFETRLFRVLKEAGFAKPVLQHPVFDGPRPVAVVDFAFPHLRVALEADGYRWHSGRARWEHDLARRNMLTSLGWRVIHITWTDLTLRPGAMINAIQKVIADAALQNGAGQTPTLGGV